MIETSPTTVGFYSYKGGTGRSTALANVAVYLASKGKRVGCIDLDVEAPGLNYIFRIDLGDFKYSLVSLFEENILDFERLVPKAIINIKEDSIVDKDFQKQAKELEGELFIIPAKIPGQPIEIDYKRSLLVVMEKIQYLFGEEKDLDYIFLDSSSGLGSAAGITRICSDLLLVFTRLDRQGIWGTYDWALDYSGIEVDEAPEYRIIASNVVKGDNPDLSLTINENIGTLNRNLKFLKMQRINLEIPQEAILSLEEKVIFFDEKNIQSDIKERYIELGDILLSYRSNPL